MNDIESALRALTMIPLVLSVWNANDRPFVMSLLEQTKGMILNVPYYRIYITAARYLGQHPDLVRIKQHDKTILGDCSKAIASFLTMQAAEDARLGLTIPEGMEATSGSDSRRSPLPAGSSFKTRSSVF